MNMTPALSPAISRKVVSKLYEKFMAHQAHNCDCPESDHVVDNTCTVAGCQERALSTVSSSVLEKEGWRSKQSGGGGGGCGIINMTNMASMGRHGADVAATITALSIKLDGLKMEMEETKKERGGEEDENLWKGRLDLSCLYNPHCKKHRHCKKGEHYAYRKKPDSVMEKIDLDNIDIPTAIKDLENVNAELNKKNNLIRLKNELLMVNVTDKRIQLTKMHFEMLELRAHLQNEIESHYMGVVGVQPCCKAAAFEVGVGGPLSSTCCTIGMTKVSKKKKYKNRRK